MTAVPPPPPPPAASAYSPAQPAPAKSSSGCLKWGLIGCGVIIVLGAIFVCAIMLIVFGAIKSSHVYKESLRRTRSDSRVIAALGTPIEAGWVVTGTVKSENESGVADINYSVHGPNGRARVHAEASKEAGREWEFSDITVTPRNGPPIDVLHGQ